ncbi:MAG: hypothetical protein RIQ78_634 [Bacteroidota bacterium]|jgi:acyl-CoA reductase-like NAD-dependent aldehyde dehydrogenase
MLYKPHKQVSDLIFTKNGQFIIAQSIAFVPTKVRRNFPAKFKAKVALDAVVGIQTLAELSTRLRLGLILLRMCLFASKK